MAALTTTTLNRAVSASNCKVQLVSGSGVVTGSVLFIDREAMLVSRSITSTTFEVRRGVAGSASGTHAAAAAVYIGTPDQFYLTDPIGVPVSAPQTTPWINTTTGVVWSVAGSSWVPSAVGGVGGSVSATASYPLTTSGVQTLLAAVPNDRTVIISVQVTQVFANGDGAQPTFSIGQTGTAAKFAATSVFTNAAAGATFSFAGTLTGGTALIVTAVAGTGTTETGAIRVTVIAS